MIKKMLLFLFCLCVGTSVGTYTAFQLITHGLKADTFQKGPWKTWHEIGKPSVDPYTQAKLVIHKWLPGSAFETLYFLSSQDETGETLNPKCTYLVAGGEIKSENWSLSVYQKEAALKAQDPHVFSVNSESILRDKAGNWNIQISPNTGSGNNIINDKNDSYTLILRLNSFTQKKLDENFGPLPSIKKVAC